jgi:hypothetical protein
MPRPNVSALSQERFQNRRPYGKTQPPAFGVHFGGSGATSVDLSQQMLFMSLFLFV